MLFKLISNGRNTFVELDGKMLGNAVTGVTFSHNMNGGERDIRASIELDLTERAYETRAFVDAKPGEFAEKARRMETLGEQYKETKDASDKVKWQLWRAYEGSAGEVKPEDIIGDIENRSKYIAQQPIKPLE